MRDHTVSLSCTSFVTLYQDFKNKFKSVPTSILMSTYLRDVWLEIITGYGKESRDLKLQILDSIPKYAWALVNLEHILISCPD